MRTKIGAPRLSPCAARRAGEVLQIGRAGKLLAGGGERPSLGALGADLLLLDERDDLLPEGDDGSDADRDESAEENDREERAALAHVLSREAEGRRAPRRDGEPSP